MPLQFDIRKLVKSKAPKAHVPNFVLSYLERIAHIHQMNAFLREHPNLRGYDFIKRVINDLLGCSATIEGAENIPTDDKPLILKGKIEDIKNQTFDLVTARAVAYADKLLNWATPLIKK